MLRLVSVKPVGNWRHDQVPLRLAVPLVINRDDPLSKMFCHVQRTSLLSANHARSAVLTLLFKSAEVKRPVTGAGLDDAWQNCPSRRCLSEQHMASRTER